MSARLPAMRDWIDDGSAGGLGPWRGGWGMLGGEGRGVAHVLRADGLAEAWRRADTTASWPLRHAQCRGVLPSPLAAPTSWPTRQYRWPVCNTDAESGVLLKRLLVLYFVDVD